ncbi:MAG: Uma2 family endonuclease [Planctomycetota bacterium]|jgi:Uma2 family endonuclease
MAISTADQLLQAGDIGRCELVRGQLRMMNPAGSEHGRIVGKLTWLLGGHVMANDLGTFYGAETGFVLSRDPDTVRAPDFALLGSGRPAGPKRGYYPGPPDLAVEVLSPDDRPGYVREKVDEWIEAGTLAVWVIDPKERTVTIHEPEQRSLVCREADLLRGGSLLPGLELAVSEVFA